VSNESIKPQSKAKILVAGGNAISSLDISEQLMLLGYEAVGQASSNEQAVSLADELRPDLVLMDGQLGGAMDGITAADLIRVQLGVPVVVLAAPKADDTLTRAKRVEPYGYIIKPFSERELGAVINMALFKHDTEVKMSEESHHRQSILDNMVDGVITIDAQGMMQSFNKAASTIFGYSAQEVIGRNVSMLMPEPHRSAHDGYLQHYRDTSEDRIIGKARELPGQRRDGSVFPMVLSVSRIARAGQPVFIGLVSDNTQRKADQDQLRKFGLAMAQSPEMIVITTPDALIEYVNEAFVNNTGFSRLELIGQNLSMVDSGNTSPGTYEGLWQTLARGEVWRGEFYSRRKDGSQYLDSTKAAPLRQADGAITHYVLVKEDVTEKRRNEEELERHRHHLEQLVAQRTEELSVARQAADAANSAKSAFLANMSHEIRTPMNAILGMAYVLRQDLNKPEQVKRLDTINNAGQYLLEIINNILDLSKVEADRLQLENVNFQLTKLFDGVAAITHDLAAKKGLQIKFELDTEAKWLHGDLTRLHQVLLNYVGNAIKFTSKGCITVRVMQTREDSDGLWLRFEVEDSGIGLTAEQIDRLFQPFEQADNSITRKYGGSGLGLSIASRLVKLMGGDVGVKSTPGVGSTFWFTACLQRGVVGNLVGQVEDRLDGIKLLKENHSGARILLVEDDEFNREVTIEILQEAGLRLDEAENGYEGVAKAAAKQYDLILMDMHMPKMDGLEATRRIRALPSGKKVPIVAMTANVYEDDRRACEAAGMNDFVSKPVVPKAFFLTILKWLSMH
jgi:PAS domain S-box-containing protein